MKGTAIVTNVKQWDNPTSNIKLVTGHIRPKRVVIRDTVIEMDTKLPTEKPKSKIYTYVQLKSISNIPKKHSDDIDIKLYHGDEEIPRLDKDCTPCNLTRSINSNCSLTFSFPLYQDSIDSLNLLSDKPVLIKLLRRVKTRESSNSDMEEHFEEKTITIGQTYLDILGFFTKKRFSVMIDTFIYPTNKFDEVLSGSSKATFQVYTLLPLLKHLQYTNVIFISFESLYNCSEELLDDPEDLIASFVFRAPMANERSKEEIIPICSFSGFKRNIINEQNPNLIWESAKSAESSTGVSFGFYTDNKLNVFRIFKRLLSTENVPLDFTTINPECDEALVCNSTHRFVLTEDLRCILEEIFNFRLQQLLIRIYREGSPENVLLEGILEPSIFLYPNVNAVRFAVVMRTPIKNVTGKKKKPKKDSEASGDIARQPCFGIISICLQTPITEAGKSFLDKGPVVDRVRFCPHNDLEATDPPDDILKERSYDSFDTWVTEVVDYIIRNNVREVNDAKNFFCCQSQNAGNRILALIALDFNRRFPTKNNIEFCNLMPTVYKELEKRIYDIIKICSEKQITDCRLNDKHVQENIIRLMNIFKIANELGDETLSKIIVDELKENYSRNNDFYFYMFLNDVENSELQAAKKYIAKPPKERKLKYEYFIRILDIYVQYMEDLQSEEIYNEAFEHLLSNLNNFLKYFKGDIDCWILLYCMYKCCDYLPGMEFARWNYQDIEGAERRTIDHIPKPRWDLYFNYDISFQSKRNQLFYNTVKVFQSIGAYKFAEIVFNEICEECTDIERYLQQKALEIMSDQVRPNCNIREFGDLTNGMRIMLEHINGNILYACEEFDLAKAHFKQVMELLDDDDDVSMYTIGISRYANYMMSQTKFEKATIALQLLSKSNKSVSVSIALGRAYYRLDSLREALECFKEATEHNLFIPDVWAYLALIHLKLGENYNALECWKQAKCVPNVQISEEIINELNNIDINEVDLYVDRPY